MTGWSERQRHDLVKSRLLKALAVLILVLDVAIIVWLI